MCTGVRAGVRYVITKFSRMDDRMDSLPNFVTHGAPSHARELRYYSYFYFILCKMDNILFEENHCTKPSVIELGSLFTQCANCFALYALALEWTFKTTEKLTEKKNNLSLCQCMC